MPKIARLSFDRMMSTATRNVIVRRKTMLRLAEDCSSSRIKTSIDNLIGFFPNKIDTFLDRKPARLTAADHTFYPDSYHRPPGNRAYGPPADSKRVQEGGRRCHQPNSLFA
jgi:hypothetical protein